MSDSRVSAAFASTPDWRRRLNRLTVHGDRPFWWLVLGAAAIVLLIALAIGFELWRNSAQARETFGWAFLWTATWDPVFREFGALPFIAGTLITSLLALVLAVPVSLGIAIFLAELAPDWLRTPLGFLVELLAAVPSVVYGLWGLFVLRSRRWFSRLAQAAERRARLPAVLRRARSTAPAGWPPRWCWPS